MYVFPSHFNVLPEKRIIRKRHQREEDRVWVRQSPSLSNPFIGSCQKLNLRRSYCVPHADVKGRVSRVPFSFRSLIILLTNNQPRTCNMELLRMYCIFCHNPTVRFTVSDQWMMLIIFESLFWQILKRVSIMSVLGQL